MERIIDFLQAELDATTMGVEQWFDTYGVAILKREAKHGLKAMGKAACAGR